tara:strand:+ start:5776 stop:7131 length:1356 start_codon:yes stop_codon:yes gene_type:complete
MKTLFPAQAAAAKRFLHHLNAGVHTLDSSDVGTGKTVVAAYIAKELQRKYVTTVAVICPKAVIPSWERELDEIGVKPLFVVNYEKIRTGKTPHLKKKGKKLFKWALPRGSLILIDEVHKCKGPWTINAELLISLVNHTHRGMGYKIHAMSATAAEDPTEMRALGYMLGLHGQNRLHTKEAPNWFTWMKQFGCAQDEWGKWRLLSRKKLIDLHDIIYKDEVRNSRFFKRARAQKLTVEQFPDSFKNNRVFVEPVEFKEASKILEAYEDLGITPAIVEDFIEDGAVTNSEHILVNILKARQLAESFKTHDIADMANDLLAHNKSVVIFVNFKDTVDALCKKLKCLRIDGSQTVNERQNVVDAFQNDEVRVIVVNIKAGGTGLSLHDINGKHARVSLISPTFSAKDHAQALGRIHRNGAKSHALQKILVASGSVEENIMKAINRKMANLHALHG